MDLVEVPRLYTAQHVAARFHRTHTAVDYNNSVEDRKRKRERERENIVLPLRQWAVWLGSPGRRPDWVQWRSETET